jgi:adenylate kinase
MSTTQLTCVESLLSIGKEADAIIKSGGLLPDDKIISLIETELKTREWLNSNSSWLLDGFPRTFGQAKKLDLTLEKSDADLNIVVELDVPEQVILDRIENRYVVWYFRFSRYEVPT